MATSLTPSTPQPLERTDQFRDNLRRWDAEYRLRARKWGKFHACKTVFLDLHTPPFLTDAILKQVFGRVPGTQNPPSITQQQFAALAGITI